jgi:hypothetical protein|tara:strand:- start:341 stop:697 length:357 start_codon:yes stop_codon:yes gene_type:complete
MKFLKIILALAIFLISSCGSTDPSSIAGDWSGTLNMGDQSMLLVVHIMSSAEGYVTTIESVNQGGVAETKLIRDGDYYVFTVEPLEVEYRARRSGNSMIGEFSQGSASDPNFRITRVE